LNNPNYPQQQPVYVQSSTLAVVSLICGILGWVGLLGIGPIIAIITGHMAKSEIARSGGQMTGSGMATAGLVLGYLNLALTLLILCLFIILPLFGIGGLALCAPFLNSINIQ
jgi:hypothetical protein